MPQSVYRGEPKLARTRVPTSQASRIFNWSARRIDERYAHSHSFLNVDDVAGVVKAPRSRVMLILISVPDGSVLRTST